MTRIRSIAEGYCAVSDRLARIAAGAAAVCLGLIPALILSDLMLRMTRLGSLEPVWEYSAYLMAASVFLGSAHTLRTGGHIRVGLLSLEDRPRLDRALEAAVTALALAIGLFLAWAMGELAWRSGIRGSLSATASAVPLVLPQALCFAGAVLLCGQLAARIVNIALGRPLETSPPLDTPR